MTRGQLYVSGLAELAHVVEHFPAVNVQRSAPQGWRKEVQDKGTVTMQKASLGSLSGLEEGTCSIEEVGLFQ